MYGTEDQNFIMDKQTFANLLHEMTKVDRDFASEYVLNHLPEESRFTIHLNQSYDRNNLKAGERVYPEDHSDDKKRCESLTENEVVDLLWRDGCVPVWIDISVFDCDTEYTYFQLLCSGRFASDSHLLYYHHRGQGPFGLKSPRFPPNWKETDGNFDLHSLPMPLSDG